MNWSEATTAFRLPYALPTRVRYRTCMFQLLYLGNCISIVLIFFCFSNLSSNLFTSIPYRLFYLNELSHLYVKRFKLKMIWNH